MKISSKNKKAARRLLPAALRIIKFYMDGINWLQAEYRCSNNSNNTCWFCLKSYSFIDS